jgi:hypothetical protein
VVHKLDGKGEAQGKIGHSHPTGFLKKVLEQFV